MLTMMMNIGDRTAFVGLELDPRGDFSEHNEQTLREACGIIPQFVAYAQVEGATTTAATVDAMSRAYGFPVHSSEGQITDEGVFQFPDDPDLAPLARLHIADDQVNVLIYPYGIVGIRDAAGDTFITRMD